MDNTHIIETALLLLLAFLIGCAIGWFIRTRFFGAPGISPTAAAAPEPAPTPSATASAEPGPATTAPAAPVASGAENTEEKSESSAKSAASKRVAKAPAKKTAAKTAAKKPAAKRASASKPAAAATEPASDGRPEALPAPRGGQKDDLKKISGVGPKLEGKLNDLGVYHFDQIAAWDKKTIAWVDTHLSFRGRIERDNWVKQAKQFAKE